MHRFYQARRSRSTPFDQGRTRIDQAHKKAARTSEEIRAIAPVRRATGLTPTGNWRHINTRAVTRLPLSGSRAERTRNGVVSNQKGAFICRSG